MSHQARPKISKVNSPNDIDWQRPLKERHLPADLSARQHHLRHSKDRWQAFWVINGTHWFSLLKQPMMVVIWCRDWEKASKFQYLMQILQVNLEDYIPRYQIFVQQEEEVDKLVQHWMEPTTLWDGRPVIGFLAESYLDDLQSVGFKQFNPMWTFPTTAAYQNWEPMTFGLAPWHL